MRKIHKMIMATATVSPLILAVLLSPTSNGETVNQTNDEGLIDTSVIASKVVDIDDPSLPKGTTFVAQKGENGEMGEYSKTVKDQGYSYSITTNKVTKSSVPEIVVHGTNANIIPGINDKIKRLETEKKAAEEAKNNVSAATTSTLSPNYTGRNIVSCDDGSMTTEEENIAYAKSVFGDNFWMADYIISHESGWLTNATNASSGAYGLAQSLPGNKMASAGANWKCDGKVQIDWFKQYVNSAHGGSLKSNYDFWVANGWY